MIGDPGDTHPVFETCHYASSSTCHRNLNLEYLAHVIKSGIFFSHKTNTGYDHVSNSVDFLPPLCIYPSFASRFFDFLVVHFVLRPVMVSLVFLAKQLSM